MTKAKDTESREMHKRLALKITVQFLALVLVFEVALILLGLLFLIIMGATNLDRTVWFEALKPFLIPLLIVLSVAGCGYISYRFMLRPLEHLDEVAEYDRQVDEANDNCPVQPRLTRALRAEAQARRRIRALQERIDKIRQLGDKPDNQQ